jgi:hypothetical protein
MSDDAEPTVQGGLDASRIVVSNLLDPTIKWSTSQCDGLVRVYNGRLQQLWINTDRCGMDTTVTEEWRDVPVMTE